MVREKVPESESSGSHESPRRGVRATPFGDTAIAYRQMGWAPIPVARSGAKAPLAIGITGHKGIDLTLDELAVMSVRKRNANVGIRLPWGIIGIDVDAYNDRNGGRTINQLTFKLGDLPLTWKSTSRMPEDRMSGIYLFRAPRRREWIWKTNLGRESGVDIIQFHHRFVMAANSVHISTGRRYMWWLNGERVCSPYPDELPMLPVEWAAYLKLSRSYAIPSVATGKEAESWFCTVSDGPMCDLMSKKATLGLTEIRNAGLNGGLHDTMTRITTYLCRSAAEGHKGLGQALAMLHSEFVVAHRHRGLEAEWGRAIEGARSQAATQQQYAVDPCAELSDLNAS